MQMRKEQSGADIARSMLNRLDGALGGGAYARTAVILFFTANEGLSILENLGLMGVPYPAFLQAALEVLRDNSQSGTEKR